MENEIELNNIEETVFIPLKGRNYVSKNFPYILSDQKAIEVASKLPSKYMDTKKDSEYDLLVSGVRSLDLNIYIKTFLARNPNGTVINVGCGLDTMFNRCDNGTSKWFEVDLKEVTDLRRKLIGENERDRIITSSMFDYEWLKEIVNNSYGPYLVVASNVFEYFPYDNIVTFLKNIKNLGNVTLLFNAVSEKGMHDVQKFMGKMGHSDTAKYFYVEDAYVIANEIDPTSKVIAEKDLFAFVQDKSKFKFMTKFKMNASDKAHKLKIVEIKL